MSPTRPEIVLSIPSNCVLRFLENSAEYLLIFNSFLRAELSKVVVQEDGSTLAEQIANEILLDMEKLTVVQEFVPEFEWDSLFTSFLKRLPAEKRRDVLRGL